jgi:diguanylate cyclase (GGDEF)-like protein
VQAAVSSHRGDLAGALELLVDAERHWQVGPDPTAECEISAVKAQLSFFTGAYAEALRHAELAIGISDLVGDLPLRVHARRTTCMVFGNVGMPDLRERIEALLELTLELGDPWEEAISRNDLAQYLGEHGDLPGADREIRLGLDRVIGTGTESQFAQAVLHCTHADILLRADRTAEASAEAKRATELLAAQPEPNPYVVGATVRADVQARMALGATDDAQRTGEGALDWLGDRVPQTRSLILSTLAQTLRQAGRTEEAYDALERAAELERQAFRELSGLQLRLERATLETHAARQVTDQLAEINRRLAESHAELEHRASHLEGVQEQLRDEADRDWLTGLYNRRFLARELQRLGARPLSDPVSLAVLDLDRFKAVNDRFGHDAGDQVLVRVSELLSAAVRGSDVVVRSGGEEFVLLMPGTDTRAATVCCERVREVIRDEQWDILPGELDMTASVGVATCIAADELDEVIKMADQRLYEAKHAGRDRVVAGGSASPESRVG